MKCWLASREEIYPDRDRVLTVLLVKRFFWSTQYDMMQLRMKKRSAFEDPKATHPHAVLVHRNAW